MGGQDVGKMTQHSSIGRPNDSAPEKVDKFYFTIENYGKCLSFPKQHLCAKIRLLVSAKYKTPPAGKTAASRETFFLNWKTHKLSLPNQLNTFIKNTETSINFSHPLINISPPIGTFSTDNCISQIQRVYTGNNPFSQDNISIMEKNQIAPMYKLSDNTFLEKISDHALTDTTQSRLFLSSLPNYPMSCLDSLTVNTLNDNYRNSPPYGETASQNSFIPPYQRLDIVVNIQREIDLLHLLFPSEVPRATLNDSEMNTTPANVLTFNVKQGENDTEGTDYEIENIKLYIDSMEIFYELFEPTNILHSNIFTSYEFNQSLLTRNNLQTFDLFVNSLSANFLFIGFTTEREVKNNQSYKDFINCVRRIPKNLEKIEILYESDQGEFEVYDNIAINELHKNNLNASKIKYINYLIDEGIIDAKTGSDILFPQPKNLDKIMYDQNVYTSLEANTNIFNIFPVSLASLKKINREKGHRYIGKSGAIARPSLKIRLSFSSSTESIAHYYLHVIQQQSKIIHFSKDPFSDQSVTIEDYAIFQ